MKKLITFLFISWIATTAFAQSGNYLSGIHFGLNTTLGGSALFYEHNYGSTDLYNHKFTPSFSGGVSVGVSVNDMHEFQLEFLYSVQGQRWEDVHEPDPAVLGKRIQLQYLRIPLIYKYKTSLDPYDAAAMSHYFVGGIYSGYLQGASVKYTIDGTEIPLAEAAGRGNNFELVEPSDHKDLFIKYDFGMILGYGFEIPLENNLSFTTEIRSETGFTDINELGWRFPSESKGYRPTFNTVLGVKVGIVYNLFL